MALQLILGRAGSGKTHLCLQGMGEALARGNEPAVFLVPEQATFQMERALLEISPTEAIFHGQVLSFGRLAWQILDQTGGAAKPTVSELGKRMVLGQLLQKHRDELRIFGALARHPGFVDKLANSIKELRSQRISPGDLLQAQGGVDQFLEDKIHDLDLIFREYDAYLQDRFVDPDDYLSLATSRLERWELATATFWVDGFSGFTPQELALLERLLPLAKQVNIALCLDPEEVHLSPENSLFNPTLETYHQLLAVARRGKVPIDPPISLTVQRRFKSRALAHVEKNFPRRPGQEGRADGSIILYPAEDTADEIHRVAQEIRRLVQEEGYAYRDLGVICRDLAPYQELLTAIFQDYQIPYFLDRKRSVEHHPLIRLVQSLLDILCGGWSYSGIFEYLKTDLSPLTREEVDTLENYVLAYGIKGSRWYRGPWRYVERFSLSEDEPLPPKGQAELAHINDLRKKVVAHLLPFYRQNRGRATVREFCIAIYNFLEELQVAGQLEDWSQGAKAAGAWERAREHEQIWPALIEFLDQLVEALGPTVMSVDEFRQVVGTGLKALQLALIPPGFDQVLIGEIERSRFPNLKGVFILGAAENSFPKVPEEDVIFTDAERIQLAASQVELGPDSRRRLFWEAYLAYIALTRPSHYLWVSYPRRGLGAREQAPSSLFKKLRRILPGAYQPEMGSCKYVQKQTLAGQLAQRLRRGPLQGPWQEIYDQLAQSPVFPRLAPIFASLHHRVQDPPLPTSLAEELYGQPLRVSITQLEIYAACPFRHFVAYGLGLREREDFALESRHLGSFYHTALELMSRPGAQLEEVMEQLIPRLQHAILASSSRYRYIARRLEKNLVRALELLALHEEQSQFRQMGAEVAFGRGLPPLIINLPGGGQLQLRGRIDRVERATIDGEIYLRVIDYKTSGTKLSLEEVYYGLSLQLLAYLMVVIEHAPHLVDAPARVAGALYFPIQGGLLNQDGPLDGEELARKRRRAQRMEGLLIGEVEVLRSMAQDLEGTSSLIPAELKKDGTPSKRSSCLNDGQFQILFHHLRRIMARWGQGILDGNVAIAPYRLQDGKGCRFCPYGPLCGFDTLLPDCNYRFLTPLNEESLWEKLEGKDQ
ncbi:MAG: helicase-exonuclease AddAB subunit AddB [Limnochordia bacterium]